MRKQTIQKTILLLMVVFTLFSCKKEDTKNDTPAGTTGTFIVDGTTTTGPSSSVNATSCGSGKDLIITTPNNGSRNFIVYNIPLGASGSSNFTDGGNTVGTCSLYAVYAPTTSNVYVTKNGSLTKTGANSFTFSCTVYDLLTNVQKTVTGSGNF
jgi:hypothetical protein